MKSLHLHNLQVYWLRDAAKRPVACIVSTEDGDNLDFGLSVHNPKDVFDKAVGRGVALDRLLFSQSIVEHYVPVVVTNRKARIMYAILEGSYPQRAKDAAALWLMQYNLKGVDIAVSEGHEPGTVPGGC